MALMTSWQIYLVLVMACMLSDVNSSPVGDWWNQLEEDQILEVAAHNQQARSTKVKPDDGLNTGRVQECLAKFEKLKGADALKKAGVEVEIEFINCRRIRSTKCNAKCGVKGTMTESYKCRCVEKGTGKDIPGITGKFDAVSTCVNVPCCCEACKGENKSADQQLLKAFTGKTEDQQIFKAFTDKLLPLSSSSVLCSDLPGNC